MPRSISPSCGHRTDDTLWYVAGQVIQHGDDPADPYAERHPFLPGTLTIRSGYTDSGNGGGGGGSNGGGGNQTKTLEYLAIEFHNGEDGKDRNTALGVAVRNSGRELAYYYHANFPDDEFPAHQYSAKQLTLRGTVTSNDTAGSTVTISISPEGDDNWYFDWRLRYKWSGDADTRTTNWVTGWELSEKPHQQSAGPYPINFQP